VCVCVCECVCVCVCVWFGAGILIVFLGLFPVWALWMNTEPLLLFLQQPPCVARYVGIGQGAGLTLVDGPVN